MLILSTIQFSVRIRILVVFNFVHGLKSLLFVSINMVHAFITGNLECSTSTTGWGQETEGSYNIKIYLKAHQ